MRADVLEVIAEELNERQAGPLASFTTWEEGRRKLDGMSKGRRWDIDREQRAFEKDNERDIRRLMKMRARHRKPEKYREAERRRYAKNPEVYRAKARRMHRKHRSKNVAKMKARRLANIEAARADSLARYYANRDARLEYMRAYGKRRHKGKGVVKLCGACRQPGHNRRSCTQILTGCRGKRQRGTTAPINACREEVAGSRGSAAVLDPAEFVGPRRGNQPEPARLGGRALFPRGRG